MPYLGEFASLLTALCWSTNAVLFSKAGRRVGSPTVNVVRLGVALLVMLALHLAMVGTLLPQALGVARLSWLIASGLIGFSLGDALLFEAYVLLGARLTVLVFTLWPVFAALLAFAFLGQSMTWPKVGAMLVTLGGIALVVTEKREGAPGEGRHPHFVAGLLLALGGALGQAVGFLFSKFGMAGGLSPVSANLVRVAAGALALGGWQVVRGELFPNIRKLKDTQAATLIGLGALFGPVIGVVLSLVAINHARYMGVASTIMSLSPVILLPYSVFIERERVGAKAVAGTVISILGGAGLFLL
jgi:drug/metabolite transporter (DMT)-like permease